MLVLGIETTCDETAAAVVERLPDGRGKILSNIVLSQTNEHAAFGGVVRKSPRARMSRRSITLSARPWPKPARLRQARRRGRRLRARPDRRCDRRLDHRKGDFAGRGKPLMAVNHLEAHALTARLTDAVPFPYCLFLASGGHTQILAVRGVGDYVLLGNTMDDAIGEAFDKTAKLLGLGYPGGPQVEKEAVKATRSDSPCRVRCTDAPKPTFRSRD